MLLVSSRIKSSRSFYNTNVVKGLKIPRVYYNHADVVNNCFVMIEQDLSMLVDAQPNGFSLEDAQDCLVKLAKFHASNWGTDKKIIGWNIGAYWTEEKECKKVGISKAWKEFANNFPQLELEKNYKNLGKRIEKVYNWVKKELKESMKHRTIVHGDYKISNIFLQRATRDDSTILRGPFVYAIDWQWFGFGNCCIDVVPFINASLQEKEFDNCKKLLRVYHTALMAQGVKNYPWEIFYHQYKVFLVEFIVFCIVGKWSKMTMEKFAKYEESRKDGLHLRRISHATFIISQVNGILQSWGNKNINNGKNKN